jgi:hypothetical protein
MSLNHDVLKGHIQSLEEALLDPAIRQSAERIESLLSGDFFEFGSSGRIYHYRKGDTFPPAPSYSIADFSVAELSAECILATYKITLGQGEEAKRSLRSTVWKQLNGQWKAVFHQGTPI